MGKTEAGKVMRGDDMMLMPNRVAIKVQAIFREEEEVPYALPGENIRIRVTGVDEESVSTGFVVCSAAKCVYGLGDLIASIGAVSFS